MLLVSVAIFIEADCCSGALSAPPTADVMKVASLNA